MTNDQAYPYEASAEPSLAHRLWNKMLRHRWFMLFVVLPSFLAILYYGLIASDIYVSEARFVIKSPNRQQSQISSFANLIQTTGMSEGQQQTHEVIDYLRSRDALADLSKNVDVKASFTSPRIDWLSRFPAPLRESSFENLHKYFNNMVDVHVDHDTSNAVITVKAFNASDAYLLNENLLQLGEALVNRLNARANSRAIVEAEKRVVIAESRLRDARINFGKYRNSTQLLDPQQQAKGVLEVSNGLEARRAALQAQIATIARITPANPSLPALRQQVAALSAQINLHNLQVVGSDSGISSKLSGYEANVVEQEFATQMLTTASASLERARADAQRQQFYLERIVEPDTPDQATQPSRLKNILSVIGISLCLYLVGWMLIVGILEHASDD
ncbi:Wzz/FepE/Etk N-terminal domain-containing protein [Sphingobium yanoikuyae]|uniref:Wzz/FepE/Etk N-terminal domain-containing protein n=1 Tax=Sphingobium yanoikuyae TaxID=13690 RepID=UPI0028AF7975|nr:Wzz/FepE/Etk N-terminal domain-containing protein [Sphingobium yanoikuyae]